MPSKCPPGVFCIENTTILFLIMILVGISILVYFLNREKIILKDSKDIINSFKQNKAINYENSLNSLPSYSYSNNNSDILMNPYSAPLRNDQIFFNMPSSLPVIPINIKTQGFDSSYRQIGILTRISGNEKILPLMGRPLISNRDKWNFYTMTDKNNMIKLPVSFKGKSCTNEYGCDNIYNGDTVYVEGYNDAFKATIYEGDTMRYIPSL